MVHAEAEDFVEERSGSGEKSNEQITRRSHISFRTVKFISTQEQKSSLVRFPFKPLLYIQSLRSQ